MRSPSYLTTIPANKKAQSTIKRLQTALRGTGFRLNIKGRNPDRQQFVGQVVDGFKMSSGFLRDTLPLQFAATFDLYVHNRGNSKTYEQLVRFVPKFRKANV